MEVFLVRVPTRISNDASYIAYLSFSELHQWMNLVPSPKQHTLCFEDKQLSLDTLNFTREIFLFPLLVSNSYSVLFGMFPTSKVNIISS